MKSLMISPRAGLRVARFSGAILEKPAARPRVSQAPLLSGSGALGHLYLRHTAPLELSEALRSRLPRATRVPGSRATD